MPSASSPLMQPGFLWPLLSPSTVSFLFDIVKDLNIPPRPQSSSRHCALHSLLLMFVFPKTPSRRSLVSAVGQLLVARGARANVSDSHGWISPGHEIQSVTVPTTPAVTPPPPGIARHLPIGVLAADGWRVSGPK